MTLLYSFLIIFCITVGSSSGSKFSLAQNRQSSLLFGRLPTSPETYLTPTQVLTYRGYRNEVHHVVTDDGYILELHRIPPAVKGSRVVFIQHGASLSSGMWLVNPANRSLPCLLADRGYDVWLGNVRGNRYSRAHKRLDPQSDAFWDFSWDEMGNYDIPAVMNYILNTTGQPKMSYVGHSMGSCMFFIAMILHPELNEKIDLMIGLAPLSTFSGLRNYRRFILPWIKYIQAVFDLLRIRTVADDSMQGSINRQVIRLFCEQFYGMARICRVILNVYGGWHLNNIQLELMPVIDSNFSMGLSFKTFAQFAQNHNAGEVFQAYDYGPDGNLQRYGQTNPFQYNVTAVTAPTYVFWGTNDFTVAPKDVNWLINRLGNLKGSTQIDGYNHADFLMGTDVKEKVYDKIFTLLSPPIREESLHNNVVDV